MNRSRMLRLALYSTGLVFLSSLLLADELPLVQSMVISKNSLKVFAQDDFKNKYLLEDFFVEYDEDIDLSTMHESLAIVPFIASVASIVWISGNTYIIDTLDQDFYDSLQNLKEVFKIFYPKTRWDGELKVTHLVKNIPLSTPAIEDTCHMALLFSYGLDSVFSSLQHRNKKQLLITGWGQDDIPLDEIDLWNSRKKKMIEYARTFGHQNTFVKSNYAHFRNEDALLRLTPEMQDWRLSAAEDIAWAGLAAPILWSKGVGALFIGSNDPDPYGLCAANPFIDENIIIAQAKTVCDQFGFNRQDKIEHLGMIMDELALDRFPIKACTSKSNKNCGTCAKCLITMLGILAAGRDLEAFGYSVKRNTIFKKWKDVSIATLPYLKRYRLQAIRKTVLQSTDPFLQKQFEWLLKADLEDNIQNTFELRRQSRIDYKALTDRFPYIRITEKIFDPSDDSPRDIWGVKKAQEPLGLWNWFASFF